MTRFLFVAISLLTSLIASAQPRLTATVDKRRIMIGEPLILEVSLTAAALPAHGVTIDTLPFFEVLERKSDTVRNGNGFSIETHLKLTSWDSGRRAIPPIVWEPGVASAPIPIDVVFSSPFDPKQPYHDEKDILDVKPAGHSSWQWYLVLGLVILLLVLLLFPKRRKDAAPVVKVDPNYYRKVLQQLQALEQDSSRRQDPKLFYTELVAIFRQYLAKKKNYHSDADTSADLIARLHRWRLSPELQAEMTRALNDADLAKFAKYRPAADALDHDIQTFKKAVIAIEEAG